MLALDADGNGVIDVFDAAFLSQQNLGVFYFVSNFLATPVSRGRCLLTLQVMVTNSTKQVGSLQDTDLELFFDIAHTSPTFQAEFNRSVATLVTGKVASFAKNTGLYGGVIKAFRVDGYPIYVVTMPAFFSHPDIGVSIIMSTRITPSSTPVVTFLGGGRFSPFSYTPSFYTPIVIFNQTMLVGNPFAIGYNPQHSVNNTLLTDICTSCNFTTQYAVVSDPTTCTKLTLCVLPQVQTIAPTTISDRSCRVLPPCPPGAYEAIPTTDSINQSFWRVCRNLTVCNFTSQYQSTVPSDSQNRQCTALTTCVATCRTSVLTNSTLIQTCNITSYEAMASTQTSDRVCLPVTVCNVGDVEVAAPTRSSDRLCPPATAASFNVGATLVIVLFLYAPSIYYHYSIIASFNVGAPLVIVLFLYAPSIYYHYSIILGLI